MGSGMNIWRLIMPCNSCDSFRGSYNHCRICFADLTKEVEPPQVESLAEGFAKELNRVGQGGNPTPKEWQERAAIFNGKYTPYIYPRRNISLLLCNDLKNKLDMQYVTFELVNNFFEQQTSFWDKDVKIDVNNIFPNIDFNKTPEGAQFWHDVMQTVGCLTCDGKGYENRMQDGGMTQVPCSGCCP